MGINLERFWEHGIVQYCQKDDYAKGLQSLGLERMGYRVGPVLAEEKNEDERLGCDAACP